MTMGWVTPTVIISTVVIFVVLGFCLFVYYSKWRQVHNARARAMVPLYIPLDIQQPLFIGLTDDLRASLEVAEEEVEINREAILGSGRSGIVYRAYFKPKGVYVAAKTNRELITSASHLRTVLQEAKVLLHLAGHPNVVEFYGVCRVRVNTVNVYLLCELCPLGSLETFVRSNRSMFVFWGDDDGAETSMTSRTETKLSVAHLYTWAYQIASAMEFVSRRKVIHSDLAARNVLLSSLDCVKLTDFGLSRRLYDDYTYMKTEPEPLPWKWLDYDALRFMIFTTHTDVWSYGITLWEIWTLGDVPYPGIVTPQCQDFMKRLLEGLHPPQPEHASEEVYELMVKCWNTSPSERPKFSWIKNELDAMMKRRGILITPVLGPSF